MGEPKHDGLAIPGKVVLAHERPFSLGAVHVNPATRQVVRGDRSETLEPRVMQVLVSLAQANGSIVTRDELIERCWDRRIVTDDAINRVLSRIRQVADSIGGGTFQLETVTKVGYRLVSGSAASSAKRTYAASFEAVAPAPMGRRAAIAAGVAAAVATAGLLGRNYWHDQPPREAVELFHRGNLAQRDGTPDQLQQSIAYFERAVRLDPLYADAWGALALAYTHTLDGLPWRELASMPLKIRSAAERALELDPDNADARLALISIPPVFRNWAMVERRLRSLCERYPRHWLAHGRLGVLLYQVGRFDDGAEFHRRVIQLQPLIAGPYIFLASALSNAGKIQEADEVLREAQERWPAHPMLWITKYNHLLFSGRPQSAAAFISHPDTRPATFDARQVGPRLTLARAIDAGRSEDVEASIQFHVRLALEQPENIPMAAPVFSLLGRLDLVFATLDRYLFNRGSFGLSVPIGRYTRRLTSTLFMPPLAAARADPRFMAMLRELGLEAYWRETRSVPDFRR